MLEIETEPARPPGTDGSSSRGILFVAYQFLTEQAGAHRLRGFVEHLPSNSWRSIALTGTQAKSRLRGQVTVYQTNKPAQRGYDGVESRLHGAMRPSTSSSRTGRGIYQVLRRGNRIAKQLLFTPDRYNHWILPAVRLGTKILRTSDVDLICSSSPPFSNHVVAYWLSRQHGLPWIADFRDPWLLDGEHKRLRVRRYVDRWMERTVCEAASLISCTTESLCQDLSRRYGIEEKVRYLPNGIDLEPPETQPARTPTKFIITHAGYLYPRLRDPTVFFEAVARFLDEEPSLREALEIRFVGYPAITSHFRERIERAGLVKNVKAMDFIPRAQLLTVLQKSDVLLLLQPSAEANMCLPSKVFDYAVCGIPMLAISPPDGETSRFVRQYGLGVAADNTVADIHSALRRLKSGNATAATSDFIQQFSRRRIAQDLVTHIEGLVASRS